MKEIYLLDGPTDFYFPYPVRYAAQVRVSVVPGEVVPPSEYQVIGAGPTATGVTIRYPGAPVDGESQLRVERWTEPRRVVYFEDDQGVPASALNAEFDNIYASMADFQDTFLDDYQEFVNYVNTTYVTFENWRIEIEAFRNETQGFRNEAFVLRYEASGFRDEAQIFAGQSQSEAEAAALSAATANDLVASATAGFAGFEEGFGYDFGSITETTTYFDQDWGSITDPV